LSSGAGHGPHAILGAHPEGARTVVRTLRRGASSVVVAAEGLTYPMERVHPGGLFETTVPGTLLDYRLDVDGVRCDDPYRYPPTIGELDLHLIGEGRHERLWKILGSHYRRSDSAASDAAQQPGPVARDGGVGFGVWAPNARGVRVVGDVTG